LRNAVDSQAMLGRETKVTFKLSIAAPVPPEVCSSSASFFSSFLVPPAPGVQAEALQLGRFRCVPAPVLL